MDPVLGRPQRREKQTPENEKYLTRIPVRFKSDRKVTLAVTFLVLMHFVANYEVTGIYLIQQAILQIRVVKSDTI